jgi:hypothetical protein
MCLLTRIKPSVIYGVLGGGSAKLNLNLIKPLTTHWEAMIQIENQQNPDWETAENYKEKRDQLETY